MQRGLSGEFIHVFQGVAGWTDGVCPWPRGRRRKRRRRRPEFSPQSFRSHVAFLADDLLEGRESGTRGYDLAAHYVASQFESLGLQPGAADGWFQPIDFVRYTTAGTPRLTIGGRTFTHGREMLLRPSPDPEPLSIAAPLVFAGFGLDLPARGFDDYAGLDVAGKIVVVLNGTPPGTPSDVSAHMNAEKARMAADRGAVGMLVIRSRSEAERVSWNRLMTSSNRPGTTWVDGEGHPVPANALRFNATIDRTAADAMFAGRAALARPGSGRRGAETAAGPPASPCPARPGSSATAPMRPASPARTSSPSCRAAIRHWPANMCC